MLERWKTLAESAVSPAAPTETTTPVESWKERMRPDGFIAEGVAGPLGGRVESYRVAASMLGESGLFGEGVGSWRSEYQRYTDNPFLRTFYLHMQFVHSDLFQFLVEWGVVGSAVFVFLLAGGAATSMTQALRGRWPSLRSTREIGLPLATLILLLHAVLDFPLQIPSILLTACALAGLCWAQALEVAATSTRSSTTPPAPASRKVALAAKT